MSDKQYYSLLTSHSSLILLHFTGSSSRSVPSAAIPCVGVKHSHVCGCSNIPGDGVRCDFFIFRENRESRRVIKIWKGTSY